MASVNTCSGPWSPQTYEPCGPTNSTTPYVSCCVAGDYCLTDGICFYTHSLDGGSGYYTAECTDPTFNDAACQKRCFDNPEPDIVYNENTNTWDCCSWPNGVRDCSNPSNESFGAPAPSNLQTLVLLPSTGTPSYASAPTTTSSSSSSSSLTTSTSQPTSSNSSSSSGLSAGASAGIGVGVALGVILAAAGIGYLIYRRMKIRRLYDNPSYGAPPLSQPLQGSGSPYPLHSVALCQELPAQK